MPKGKLKKHAGEDLESAVEDMSPAFVYSPEDYPGLTPSDVKQLFAQNSKLDNKGNTRPNYLATGTEKQKYQP